MGISTLPGVALLTHLPVAVPEVVLLVQTPPWHWMRALLPNRQSFHHRAGLKLHAAKTHQRFKPPGVTISKGGSADLLHIMGGMVTFTGLH